MKYLMLFAVLVYWRVASSSAALQLVTDHRLADEASPRCDKIDSCSCKLRNTKETGIIDLNGLVNGEHKPRFVAEGDIYYYPYNPCTDFTGADGCVDANICQINYNNRYSRGVGKIDSAEFIYTNGSLFVIYNYTDQAYYPPNRTAIVELVCNKTEVLGKFEYHGEQSGFYNFKLKTRCACPGECKRPNVECVPIDSCTCEMSDGSGLVNLHAIDKPTNPMRDSRSPTNSFLYNPCSPIKTPDCEGNSLCEERGNSLVYLGLANMTTFEMDKASALTIKYKYNSNLTSTVNLYCDHGQRDEPFFRVTDNKENTYDMYSVCACPGGCVSPPTCNQTDSCTCISHSDGAVIDLHELDNPHAPLTTKDANGYTYYYNPCSGLQYEYIDDDAVLCKGSTGCQKDPFVAGYNSLGNASFIEYDSSSKYFTFHYTGGWWGRRFDIRMVCDINSDKPVFVPDKEPPPGTYYYHFKLITKYACNV